MVEEWKELKGFEDKYKISSKGNIFNKENDTFVKTRISKDGYVKATLYYNKKSYSKEIHRLVAETFIVKDNKKKLEVNHKDGNKQNNSVDNLEWITHRENIIHAWNNNLFEAVRKASIRNGRNNPNAKRVMQYDMKGNRIKEWDCITEASIETNISKTNIGNCCNKRQKSAGGFYWEFATEVI